jgi:hypothetical protein
MAALVLALLAGVLFHSESRAEPKTSPGFPCEIGPENATDEDDGRKECAINNNGGVLPLDVRGWLGSQGYTQGNGREQMVPSVPGSSTAPQAPAAPQVQEIKVPAPLPSLQQAPEPGGLALLLIGAGALVAGWRFRAPRAT